MSQTTKTPSDGLAQAEQSDIVAAAKGLNEMHGFNAPQKVEHSGAIRSITRRTIDVGVTLERSGD